MSRVSRNARGEGIRARRGGGFQMGRLYMVSGWAGVGAERLAPAMAAAGSGSVGAESEEESRKHRRATRERESGGREARRATRERGSHAVRQEGESRGRRDI